jgi:hypothetical protein
MTSYKTKGKNKNWRRSENPRFNGQKKPLPFSPWVILATWLHIVAYRSPSKNIGKWNLQPILNKNSPWAHMELELDMLDVARKLVKYSLYSKLLECFKKFKVFVPN